MLFLLGTGDGQTLTGSDHGAGQPVVEHQVLRALDAALPESVGDPVEAVSAPYHVVDLLARSRIHIGNELVEVLS